MRPVSADTPVGRVLSRLDVVSRVGPHQWKARCPFHEDRRPSLSVGLGRDGRVLLRCWAGCHWRDVVESMGLSPRDLFPRYQDSFSSGWPR